MAAATSKAYCRLQQQHLPMARCALACWGEDREDSCKRLDWSNAMARGAHSRHGSSGSGTYGSVTLGR